MAGRADEFVRLAGNGPDRKRLDALVAGHLQEGLFLLLVGLSSLAEELFVARFYLSRGLGLDLLVGFGRFVRGFLV